MDKEQKKKAEKIAIKNKIILYRMIGKGLISIDNYVRQLD